MGRSTHLRRVPNAPSAPSAKAGSFRARVEALQPDGALEVCNLSEEARGAAEIVVRLAMIAGYRPSVGDEVLVVHDGLEAVAVAVLTAQHPPALFAADGSRVEVVAGAIEFRDHDGRLLVRYRSGSLEVAPETGDLRLRAPAGAVRLEAATDIAIVASRDLRLEASRSADLATTASSADGLCPRVHLGPDGAKVTGRKVELRARHATTVAGIADVVATEVRTSADKIVTHARKVETTAERVTLRAKELAQEIAGVIDTKAGRVRSLVRGAFSLRTKTVNMKSEQDTSIDGRRVLLG